MVLRILKVLDKKPEDNVIRLEEAMKRAVDSSANLECVSIDLSVSLVQQRACREELVEEAAKHFKKLKEKPA